MTESNPSPKIPARVRSRTISATCSTTRLIDRIVLEQISQKGKRESTALTGVTVGDCKPIENQLIEGLQDLAPERAVSDSWQERDQARNYRQRLGDEVAPLIGAATLIAGKRSVGGSVRRHGRVDRRWRSPEGRRWAGPVRGPGRVARTSRVRAKAQASRPQPELIAAGSARTVALESAVIDG